MTNRREREEFALTPLDNRALANLCGPLDANLRQIEAALDVAITHRGGAFTISGNPAQTRLAAEVVRRFYTLAEKPLSVDDIQLGLIELTTQRATAPGVAAGDDDGTRLRTRRADLHGRTPNQALYLKHIQEHDITFGIGPAGTGKTYLAVAAAVHLLRSDRARKVILARPAVEAGERLGFLPGDLEAKVNPYLRPLFDALNDMMDYATIRRFMETDVVQVVPLAYMRGRTLNNAIIILDEAQNTTKGQMQMFLTRMGQGSKMIVTGDVTQIDLPKPAESGLIDAARRLSRVPGIGFVTLDRSDVVRHSLVQKIVDAYGEEGQKAM